MKWKLDENFGSRSVHLFLSGGHDAETVLDERLGGSSGETQYAHCIREDRCLLTLDMEFADIVQFPPHQAPGIAVSRLRGHPSLRQLETLVAGLLRFVATTPIRGRLWIVEPIAP